MPQHRLKQRASQAKGDEERRYVGEQQVLRHVRVEQLVADLVDRRDEHRDDGGRTCEEAELPPRRDRTPLPA